MLKKLKDILEKIFSHSLFNLFISLIILFSIILLFIEKIIDLSPNTYFVLETIDSIIVFIFTVEFIIKFLLWRVNYFIKEYGWVDFLSILPVFSPALKSIRIIRSVRTIRIIRLLRLLRVIRIIKISNYYNYSPLKQKVFVPASTLMMISVIITGFLFINNQEDVLLNYEKEKFQQIIRMPGEIDDTKLLQIVKDNKIIFQKFNQDILKIFLLEHIIQIKEKNKIYIFSVKDTFDQINKFELKVIIISISGLLILLFILNYILDKTILNPIINIDSKMDKIVTIKDVPLSGDKRITINFDQSINYDEPDEIGSIVKHFNYMLALLKKQQSISKNALGNLCTTIMNIFEHYHAITRGHQYRTAILATAIGFRMGIKKEELENIFYGAILHDIGKIAVDKNVLMKPGRFTDEERKEMQRHPGLGYKIALDFPLLSETELIIIRDHHEQLSGRGYPSGLKGDEIILAARIVALADIFDAIACPRDYKNAKPVEAVLAIIDDMKGKWLDKKVIDMFKKMISEKIINVDCTHSDPNKWIVIDEKKLGMNIDFLQKTKNIAMDQINSNNN